MTGLITEEDAAELLKVSKYTVARMRKAGQIAYRRVRGRVRYSLQDVEGCIESCATVSLPSKARRTGTSNGLSGAGLSASQLAKQIRSELRGS